MVPWFLEFVPGKIREVKNGFETGFELVRVFFLILELVLKLVLNWLG